MLGPLLCTLPIALGKNTAVVGSIKWVDVGIEIASEAIPTKG
jgi:hypothetical protein